jgi:hypothetical protein
MYACTTSSVTDPTEEMNLLRVYRVGNRGRSHGNWACSSWEVNPLILATTDATPTRGSTSFGLHAEEVEGGDCTQIDACRRRRNRFGRWVAEARWLNDCQLWRGAQDALDILLVHLADDDEDGGARVCTGHRLDAHGLHVGPVEAQAPGEIALPRLPRLIVPLADRLACCLRFRGEQVYP